MNKKLTLISFCILKTLTGFIVANEYDAATNTCRQIMEGGCIVTADFALTKLLNTVKDDMEIALQDYANYEEKVRTGALADPMDFILLGKHLQTVKVANALIGYLLIIEGPVKLSQNPLIVQIYDALNSLPNSVYQLAQNYSHLSAQEVASGIYIENI